MTIHFYGFPDFFHPMITCNSIFWGPVWTVQYIFFHVTLRNQIEYQEQKKVDWSGIRTHAPEEIGALIQRLRPLGHPVLKIIVYNTYLLTKNRQFAGPTVKLQKTDIHFYHLYGRSFSLIAKIWVNLLG